MRAIMLLGMAAVLLGSSTVSAQTRIVIDAGPAELAPPPRPVVPAIRLFPSPGGFQIALSRRMAEILRDTLDAAADEKQIAKLLRENAKKQRDESGDANDISAAKLELVAFVVSFQLPAFKKAMHERMGANGVVIQVMGVQRPTIFRKPRPILEKGLELAGNIVAEFTPEDVGRTIEAARAMAKTTPLSWTVLPQE
jgi:hypothetical protein